MLPMRVGGGVGAGGGQRGRGAIHGLHGFAAGGQVQGEAAGGGEAIERLAAAGVAGGGAVVLALVQEDAGLLAAQQVGPQGEAVHVHGDGLGDLAQDHARFERQLFLGANRGVVAGHDALGMENLFQAGDDLAARGVHALVERLHDQVIAVAVHDQGGEEVGLGVDYAVGVAVRRERTPVLFGGAQPAQEEIAVDFLAPAARACAGRSPRWSCSARFPAGGRGDRRP